MHAVRETIYYGGGGGDRLLLKQSADVHSGPAGPGYDSEQTGCCPLAPDMQLFKRECDVAVVFAHCNDNNLLVDGFDNSPTYI